MDEKIKSYSAYIHGVALPFYNTSIQKNDIEPTEEFDDVINPVTKIRVKDWVTLMSIYNEKGIGFEEFNKKIKTNGNLDKYLDSKYKWAMSIGIWHHFKIKEYIDQKNS